MLLQRWFVRLTIPTSPPPNLGIAQSDKIHSLIMQFSLFRLLLQSGYSNQGHPTKISAN